MTDVVSQYVSGRTVQEQMCELMKFVSTVNGKSVKKIEGSQSDDTVTVTVTYEDDRTDVFSFVATSGVTRDTAQTISGMKVFSADTTQFTHDVDIGGVLNVADTAEINVLEVDTNATIGGDETVDGNLSVGGNVAITGNVTSDLNVVGDIANHHMAIEEYNGDTVLAVEQNLILNDGTTVPTSDSTGKVATTKWVQDARNADASIVRTTGNQTIGGRKAFSTPVAEGSHSNFRQYTKFTDVDRTTVSDTRNYIWNILDRNEQGICTHECGKDSSGNRAYYAIAFGGIVVDGAYKSAQLRVSLSASGVSLQLFDPINNVWRSAVLQ